MISDRIAFGLRRRSERRQERRARGERGETLVELIATVGLLGTAIIGIVTLMMALLVATNLHRRHVKSAIDATVIAESIQRAAYLPCPGSVSGYNTALPTPAGPYVYSIESVRYLTAASMAAPSGSPVATAPASAFGSSCPGAGDQGAQQITVLARSVTQNTVEERVVVVKRQTACPATVATTPGQTC